MIKHIVAWKLKDEADGRNKNENALLLKTKLEELQHFIGEIKSLEVGINSFNSQEGNWDIVLITEFESQEVLMKYQNHEKHLEVVQFVRKVRELRAAVDYIIN